MRSGLCLQEQMKLMKQRRSRWRSLEWTRIIPYSLEEGCPIYELSSGVFAQLFSDWDQAWEEIRWGLNILHLPSETRGIDELVKVRHLEPTTDQQIRELCVDPEQDLLMLIKHVHISDDSDDSGP